MKWYKLELEERMRRSRAVADGLKASTVEKAAEALRRYKAQSRYAYVRRALPSASALATFFGALGATMIVIGFYLVAVSDVWRLKHSEASARRRWIGSRIVKVEAAAVRASALCGRASSWVAERGTRLKERVARGGLFFVFDRGASEGSGDAGRGGRGRRIPRDDGLPRPGPLSPVGPVAPKPSAKDVRIAKGALHRLKDSARARNVDDCELALADLGARPLHSATHVQEGTCFQEWCSDVTHPPDERSLDVRALERSAIDRLSSRRRAAPTSKDLEMAPLRSKESLSRDAPEACLKTVERESV